MKNTNIHIIKKYDDSGNLIFKKNIDFWIQFFYDDSGNLEGYKTSDGIIWNYSKIKDDNSFYKYNG